MNKFIEHNMNIPNKLTSKELVEIIATAKEVRNASRKRTYSGGFVIVLDQETIELSWDNNGKPYISIYPKEQFEKRDLNHFRTVVNSKGEILVNWEEPLEYPDPIVEVKNGTKTAKCVRQESATKKDQQQVDSGHKRRGRPKKQVD